MFQDKCLSFFQKTSIIESNASCYEKAMKLYDIIWRADVKFIDIFLNEVQKLLPHLFKCKEGKLIY